jgi:hypothetical protein
VESRRARVRQAAPEGCRQGEAPAVYVDGIADWSGRPHHRAGLRHPVGNSEHGTDLAAESKRRKTFLGADAKRALYQVVSKAIEYGRKPAMCYAVTEGDDLWVPVVGGLKPRKARMIRRWVMMPLDFVEELLRYRRIVAILRKNDYCNAMWEGAWLEDQLADVTVESEQEEVSDGV